MSEFVNLSDDHLLTTLSFLPSSDILTHISYLSRRFAHLSTSPALWRQLPLTLSHRQCRQFCREDPFFPPAWNTVSTLSLYSGLSFPLPRWQAFLTQFRSLKHVTIRKLDILQSLQDVVGVLAAPASLESLHVTIGAGTLIYRSRDNFCVLDWLSQHFPALRGFHFSCGMDFPSLTHPCSPELALPRPPLTSLTLDCSPFAPEWLTSFPSLTSLSIKLSGSYDQILAVLPDLGRHLPVLRSLGLTYGLVEVLHMPFVAEWAHTMRHLHTISLTNDETLTTREVWELLACFAADDGGWPALRVVEIHTHRIAIDPNAALPGGVLSLLSTIEQIVIRVRSGWNDPEVKQQILDFLSGSECVVDCGVPPPKPKETGYFGFY
eukprot:TRINITY_DN5547_c0_g1_i5.p1 TRINITY_DN5547_c0_g1~~TRINITY_DN5547_c0_g1_i5.p1  ORF type:complete len:378 (+),score=50.75 TRINITY_DN5547_c0_g1_i5:71-1204(+)